MKKTFVFLFLVLSLCPVLAASFNMRQITNKDGLSNSSVNVIFQDSSGIMWFGTWDGLNMFNSKDFTVYKPDLTAPRYISNNIIREVIEEPEGILWIATDHGINRLNTKEKDIKSFFYENVKDPQLTHVQISPDGKIFASVYNAGLFYYDPDLEIFVPVNNIPTPYIKRFFFDNSGDLWLYADFEELLRIELQENPRGNIEVKKSQMFNQLQNKKIALYDSIENRLWIQTGDKLIYTYDLATNKLSLQISDASFLLVTAIFEKNRCLLGTNEGLFEQIRGTSHLTCLLSNISVFSLCKGSQDILWVGSDGRGVFMLTNEAESFETYSIKKIPAYSTHPVRAIWEDREGTLWVGTKGNGLFTFKDKEYGEIDRYTTKDGLLSNLTLAIAGYTDDCFWISAEYGLNYFNTKTKKIHTLQTDGKLNLSNIYTIYMQNDTTLWVGTFGFGVFKLIIDKSVTPYRLASFKQYAYQNGDRDNLSNNVVFSIIPDGKQGLWIGTRGGGLNHLDLTTSEITVYRHSNKDKKTISNDDILSLYIDKKDKLWIGTSMGLNCLEKYYESGNPIFRRYTESDGIANNTIHGILGDSLNNIWLSTNKGIAKLIPETGRIISYFEEDGLQNNEFSDGAYYMSPYSGAFYFGGISGFNKFDPLKITDNNYIPSLHLDGFSVNNKEVNIKDYMRTKTSGDVLTMTHNDKFFSFMFTPIDYISGSKCEISYKLENHDSQWIRLRHSGTIVFSNLPSGNYVLKVKCSNSHRIWSDREFELPIRILPPWWLSWYAYTAYLLILLCAGFMTLRIVKNRIKFKHLLQLKNLEKQKTEEIHQAKLRFFTNIAHEFCNSLTLIYGPSERLLKNASLDFQSKRCLNTIRSNAERMQQLIQQLMEFRKVETGYLEICLEPVDIQELIKYTLDHFTAIAEQKKINIIIEVQHDLGSWITDRGCMEKILFNLLSNAFKYTPDEGFVRIKAARERDIFKLTVINCGKGIKEEDLDLIFNRFKILDDFEKDVMKGVGIRTGIGLALCKSLTDLLKGSISVDSELGKSTSFSVTFPQLNAGQKKEGYSTLAKSTVYEKMEPVESDREPEYIEQEDKNDNQLYLGKKTSILIVEDDVEIRDFLLDILNDKYEVFQAKNGFEGLEILESKMIDLIICDIIMPQMNGVEFVLEIKKRETTSHIPVVFLSSDTSIDRKIEGLHVGGDAYINKPFHTDHLEATIERLLSSRRDLKKYYDSAVSTMEEFEGRQIDKDDKKFVLNLIRFVSENLDNENLSIELLSEKMAVSKMQLYRKIKELKGETPTEFIRNIRLKQVERLLRTTNKTVQEIMYSCGFNSKAYFYQEFSKQYHATPKEYRTMHNKN